MFNRILSPKGGQPLKSLQTWPAPKEENTHIAKGIEHGIVNDWHALKIGYLEYDLKKGEPLFIKPSDAKILYKLLKREVGE